MAQKIAGHFTKGHVYCIGADALVVTGMLTKDVRGTDYLGSPRNFSGRNVRTSVLQSLEYVENTDTTIITTMNSIYYSPGNLIKEYLGLDVLKVSGETNVLEAFKAYQLTLSKSMEA